MTSNSLISYLQLPFTFFRSDEIFILHPGANGELIHADDMKVRILQNWTFGDGPVTSQKKRVTTSLHLVYNNFSVYV
jgi:hypothetical protein